MVLTPGVIFLFIGTFVLSLAFFWGDAMGLWLRLWLTDGTIRGPGAGGQRKIHPTFRWWAANLLAFTKFVGIGLLIK